MHLFHLSRLDRGIAASVALAVASIVLGPAGAAPQMPALPKVVGPIAASSESPIYSAEDAPGATASVHLKDKGYVEDEFFLSGSANLYRYDESWNRLPIQGSVPYTTRIIVRRPGDAAKFSGNVQFECAHPQLAHTSNWDAAKRYMVRHGDIYVSMMCGADARQRENSKSAAPTAAHDILKWFDPKRYAAIAWPDDDGVRWDAIAQAGALLKSKDRSNPIAAYKVERMYAAGWSFTGSLWRTYINEGFHDDYRMPDGSPIFDGYLIGISSGASGGGYLPLSNAYNLPVGNARRITKSIDVPVIELLSENEAITNFIDQAPESDEPKSRHRLYEVPARTHSSGPVPGVTGSQAQLAAKAYPTAPAPQYATGCTPEGSDVPMGGITSATLANLDAWVRKGIPPPHAERMKVDRQAKKGVKDVHGNTEGGVRTAELDVPLAQYGDYLKPGCARGAGATSPYLPMWRVSLPVEDIRSMYKDENDYLAKFKARLDRMVRERWLLQAEADEQYEAAKTRAATAFAK